MARRSHFRSSLLTFVFGVDALVAPYGDIRIALVFLFHSFTSAIMQCQIKRQDSGEQTLLFPLVQVYLMFDISVLRCA